MTTTAAPRLGLAFVPTIPPERLRGLAEAVEASGLDDLWVWEDCFKQSGLASAAAALAWTDEIRVGIGLLPVPLRNVALTAMEIATLTRMFPGRVVPGVGHGVQPWMEQVGARVQSPMTLLREYVTALRALLAGTAVTTAGRYVQLDDVRLNWPPDVPPPLMLGGAGPRSLELTAEIGDGTLLGAALTDDAIRDAAAIVRRVRADIPGGQDVAREFVVTQIVATGDGAQERVDAEVPRWGSPPDQGIGAAGDAEAIADSVRRLVGLGATTVIFQPTEDEPDLVGLIRFLGQAVRPLLHT